MIPQFSCSEWLHNPIHGLIAIVPCDKQRDRDNPGLAGELVSINDEVFRCTGVERYMPRRPIKAGEMISLHVTRLIQHLE